LWTDDGDWGGAAATVCLSHLHDHFSLFSLIRQGFRTRAALHAEVLALRNNSWFSKDPAVAIATVWRVRIDCCGSGSRVFEAAGDPALAIVFP
jgi:hypothetical protein